MSVRLTAAQKDEVRRLTQLANRRIKAAERAYSKEGLEVLPSDVVGRYQTKESWNTESTPISRSVKFESPEDYRRQLHFLRGFEQQRPGIKEYSEIQRNKTNVAVSTALGDNVPESIQQRLSRMSAPELSKFWNTFSDKASRLGLRYSSESAMRQTLDELFPEDMAQL